MGAWGVVGRGVVALALSGGLASCSLGEKQDIAERIVRARSVETGPLRADVGLGFELVDAPAGAEIAGAGGGRSLGGGGWPAAVDFGTGRSAVLAPAAAAARIAALAGAVPTDALVLVVSDREAMAVRRPAGTVVAARPWFRLELDRAKETTKPDAVAVLTGRSPGDAALLTPTLMVDLLAGVLPGSVEVADDGRVSGRFSFDKAAREDDLTDDEIDAREHAFRLFAVTNDVHDFEVLLADDGSIRELAFDLLMTPDKVSRFRLHWGMRVTGPGPALELPDADDAVAITSYNQARNAVTDWMTEA